MRVYAGLYTLLNTYSSGSPNVTCILKLVEQEVMAVGTYQQHLYTTHTKAIYVHKAGPTWEGIIQMEVNLS